ncbi:MAG: DNA-processing protein DprA [Patescibacteria group bacterium]
MNENKSYFAFSLIKDLGPKNFQKINTYFSSIKQAWDASHSELAKAGLADKIISEIIETRNKINLDQELEKIFKQNINIVTLNDNNYPKLLKQISNPPFLLYYRGKLKDERDKNSIAVVGTRKISNYGKLITDKFVNNLVNNNLTIISGLALGVDAVAHQTCLNNNGRTIAVLGSGLDYDAFYPKDNWRLAEKIIENNGLILSEYPPATKAQRHFFPLRNRIVAGLSLGTLVVEAPIKSGALLTAKIALDQNREVFAVPGAINTQNSTGPHDLIKQGAKLVDNIDDILNELNLRRTEELKIKNTTPSNPQEEIILNYLLNTPASIDELIQNTKLDSSTINSTLTIMEISGKIKSLNGVIYIKI